VSFAFTNFYRKIKSIKSYLNRKIYSLAQYLKFDSERRDTDVDESRDALMFLLNTFQLMLQVLIDILHVDSLVRAPGS
jgi:flagellar biosynthesis regulator FlbT